MKNLHKKMNTKIKFLLLALILGLGLNYAIATFGPTSTPPGNNKANILDQSTSIQTKGGSGTPVPGSLLNIDGTLSATNLFVATNAVIDADATNTNPNGAGDFYINSLVGLPTRVCVNAAHKLILCGSGGGSGPICGNGIVEAPEQCDDGAGNGEPDYDSTPCSLSCTNVPPACSDGLDNDGDSLIDYPADPGCTSASDFSEFNGGGSNAAQVFYVCFISDTQVTMADGSKKNIQDVKIGDVLKGETTNNTVLRYHRPLQSEGVTYGFNGGRSFVTAEHPFKTTQGWKSINPEKTRQENIGIEVTQLKVGDTILTENGSTYIFSIEAKQVPIDTPLYNFALSGDRTYYADGYLVHNKVPCDPNLTCVDSTTHLLTMPGDPEGDVLPNGCNNIGQIYAQGSGQNPPYMPGCGSSYWYRGCYAGGVNGSPGIVGCANVAP